MPRVHEYFSQATPGHTYPFPMQIAVGGGHLAIVSFEKRLYTWNTQNVHGNDGHKYGQLGHGDVSSCRNPKAVSVRESYVATGDLDLGGKHDEILVEQVACGIDFTICLGENGQVYSWGSNDTGCLGFELEGDAAAKGFVTSPCAIDRGMSYFGRHPVEQLSCGLSHVLARTQDGSAYAWGSNDSGCLGQ